MAMKPGLVSITFRGLTPQQIINGAVDAGVEGIEWGGDVHVPHGELATAREVAERTRDAGLAVSSYGSYYRFNESDVQFSHVLATAVALGAPVIRVWAGRQGSADADAAEWSRIIEASRRVGDEAADAGIRVGFEFHGGTLTDTNESAVRLLKAIDHPNVGTFWQPPNGKPVEYALEGLDAVLPWLQYLHCFHWRGPQRERRPLSEGADRWMEYLDHASRAIGGPEPRWVLLEFVQDDSLESLSRDAAELRRLLG